MCIGPWKRRDIGVVWELHATTSSAFKAHSYWWYRGYELMIMTITMTMIMMVMIMWSIDNANDDDDDANVSLLMITTMLIAKSKQILYSSQRMCCSSSFKLDSGLSSHHMRKVSQVRNNAIICDDAQVLSITGHDRYHCTCACKNLK